MPGVSAACILIPTYNNARSLRDVVERSLATGLEVLVVDDGSTDGTGEVLAGIEGIGVLSHPLNQGKGAALETGFAEAQARGFSHAITLDSDGQHYPEDVPQLLEALEREPEALIIGARDLLAAGAGKGSRFGCRVSNFWTRVETGERLPDTQTGYRVYPLDAIRSLVLKNRRFGYEVEVLVKASWCGVPLRSVPVRVVYDQGDERVSHFRPVVDFLRIAALNTHLVFLRVALPPMFLALICKREFHALGFRARVARGARSLFLEGHGPPLHVAGSVALGLFMGIAPFWGFQVALTLTLAHLLRASKAVAVLAAHVSFPLMIPPILYASLVLGRRIRGGAGGDLTGLDLERADFLNWVVGSFALAGLVSAAGFALTLLAFAALKRPPAGWKTE